MATLTHRRFTAAQDILERYRLQLRTSGHFVTGVFERELRDRWGLGYQELKGVMIELLGRPDFTLVAAYYMQHSNAPGPVSEFKRPLADLYGIRMYDSAEREAAQRRFWENALATAG